ncbi:hypothetical protein ABZY16_13115 [Streptomyces sp. NPDC006553]|uniref:hypothetical protein n=1 Tax=unclassified Streptomyces TaxID=2593676 RepID=UPI00225444E4|nr:hypothetical protein [Streptomyces sp. NBC_00233]MCX5226894.1 hypothetical protein [Streptomyces sp. NBC_00233]
MHRGGGPGEGTDDLGPESARRGRHRRRRSEDSASGTPGTPSTPGIPGIPDTSGPPGDPVNGNASGSGRLGVTYKYFGAPDGATAARVPISMRPEELGGDELGMGGMFTKIKPETIAAMVLTGIQGMPLNKVPPLELVVLHPDYAVVKLPMTVVDPLRAIGEESVGAAAFIWSTVPDRGGPRDAFDVYQLLHEWQDFSVRLHEAGHQPYCLVWP